MGLARMKFAYVELVDEVHQSPFVDSVTPSEPLFAVESTQVPQLAVAYSVADDPTLFGATGFYVATWGSGLQLNYPKQPNKPQ